MMFAGIISGILISSLTLSSSQAQTSQAQTSPDQTSQAQTSPEQTSQVQTSPEQTSAEQAALEASEQLKQIQGAITLSTQRREELRQEIEQMDGDRSRQNAALIAAAQRVTLTEIEVYDTESRMSTLLTEESLITDRLENADVNISNLLAALQRIGKNPPPALIINPSDALSSARSALLLSSILPQLRQKADIIITDLNNLTAIKSEVLEEQAQLIARYSTLFEEKLRIATLIEARKRGIVRFTDDLASEEARAEALASQASSINELIETLQTRIASIAAAASAANAEQPANGNTPLSNETITLAFANTERTSPAIPFSLAQGHLVLPAAGVMVSQFGTDDGFGGIAKGTSIVTRADAQVVAPADGWVMYKGPYLNYGQIIILNPGQNHTILLAGLNEISVELGQFILLGEPVGTMGSRTIGRTLATNAGVSRPTLYIEIRNQDEPLNPTPWWAPSGPQAQAHAQNQDG